MLQNVYYHAVTYILTYLINIYVLDIIDTIANQNILYNMSIFYVK